MPSYSEKLKDPRWQKRRLKVLEKHRWTCEDCGGTASTLEVHHCYYITGRQPWEYDDDLLMCLCSCCHQQRQTWERSAHVQLAIVLRVMPVAEVKSESILQIERWLKIRDRLFREGLDSPWGK